MHHFRGRHCSCAMRRKHLEHALKVIGTLPVYDHDLAVQQQSQGKVVPQVRHGVPEPALGEADVQLTAIARVVAQPRRREPLAVGGDCAVAEHAVAPSHVRVKMVFAFHRQGWRFVTWS